VQQSFSRFGQSDRAMLTDKELRTEVFFQSLNLTTDGRLGQTQVLCRLRNAHTTSDGNKAANGIQRR